MLEFYRPHADYRALMEDVEGALSHCAQGQGLFAKTPYQRLTVHEAMLKHAGVDWHTLKARPGDSWDDTFFRIFLDHVEPKLGLERPTFLCEYPAPMAALARLKRSDPSVAERVELYAAGVELGNGFSELTDAAEQRKRLIEEQDLRRAAGRPAFALDEKFLEALSRMPPSAGIAIGLDRVLMVLTGSTRIAEVLLFPAADF
jgi:lysyl-tRNA synthetase class 2